MTSRNINVNIVAKTGRYSSGLKKAMRETALFDKSLSGLADKAAKLGSGAVIGGVVALGVAMGAIGIKGAKAFADFELTMSRIEGLVGVAHDEVLAFGDGVRQLASDTAQGPQDLAEALFFITSAGLEGADAMDALEQAAKASTAGLGDVVTIADLLTSAVNAYGDEVITAEQATDVLVATVREGKAAAPELASAMGRVIPIASQMGIEFDQVGAAIAAMTRVGLDANESTTALRSIMTSLLNPTADAARALDEVGLSASGIRQTMAGDGGLLQGLIDINDAFDGQADATTRVFGNVRALTGVLSLMGSNLEDTRDIFDEVADSAGTAADSFQVAADTSAFAFKQAKVDIENALLGVGEQILPDIAAALGEVAPMLPELIGSIGDLTIAFVDLAASAAPAATELLKFATETPGRMRSGLFKIAAGVDAFNNVFDTLLGPTINIADFVGDADRDLDKFNKVMWAASDAMDAGMSKSKALATSLAVLAGEGQLNQVTMQMLQDTFRATDSEMGTALTTVTDLAAGLGITAGEAQFLLIQFGYYTEATEAVSREQEQASETARLLGASQRWLATQVDDTGQVFEDTGPVLTTYGEAIGAAMEKVDGLANAILELSNPAVKAIHAVEKMRTAEDTLNDTLNDTKSTAEEVAQAQLDFAVATFEAQGALDAVRNSAGSVDAAMQILTDALGLSDDEARDLLETLGLLDGTDVNATVTVTQRGQFEPYNRPAGAGGARAHGGPVVAGQSYLVGERGVEEFIPNASGRIRPNSDVATTASGATYSTTVIVRNSTHRDLRTDISAGLVAGGVNRQVETLVKQ